MFMVINQFQYLYVSLPAVARALLRESVCVYLLRALVFPASIKGSSRGDPSFAMN